LPKKVEERRRVSLFNFGGRKPAANQGAPPEVLADEMPSPRKAPDGEAPEKDTAAEVCADTDGSLNWEAWLEHRLAPAGPMVLVEALKTAGLAGRPDLLRAAISEVEAHGPGLTMSLDRSPCPDEVLHHARRGGGSAAGLGLWTWAVQRLTQLESAEAKLASFLAEAQMALEKFRKPSPDMTPRPSATQSHLGRKIREALKRDAGRLGPRAAKMDMRAAVGRLHLLNAQEQACDMEHRLRELLQALDERDGLRGGVRDQADVVLKELKAEQENLFDRFVALKSPIKEELESLHLRGGNYGVMGFEFGLAELARHLEAAIQAAQREVGARLLLGERALEEARSAGLGLASSETEPRNPWRALTRNPPPWEACFRKAISRWTQMKRSLDGEASPYTSEGL